MNDRQRILAGQEVIENWRIKYTLRKNDSPIVAQLDDWPHYTYYTARGDGASVEEARLSLITNLAKAIHRDPDPFGDLGKVAHISQVIKFLAAIRDGGHPADPESGIEFKPPSDYYLPEQLSDDVRDMLPVGWEDVISHVIDLVSSWADYYPEEHTDKKDDVPLKPPA